jgi:tetratricopeptide (TPR) repeat protein
MGDSGTATPETSASRKPCIKCRELIPADATICSHCRSSQTPPKKNVYKDVFKWVGGIAAIIGLLLSAGQLFGPAFTRFHNHREVDKLLSEAKAESDAADYQTALATYDHALQLVPNYAPAIEGRCDTAMTWLRNFHIAGEDDKELASRAATQLSALFPILEAALAGQKGPRQADILAHIGWAHWLSFHIALKDVPSSAKESFDRALSVDAGNVYANAMLGNWLIQRGDRLAEAKPHFDLAVQSGKERTFVRALQLGGMIYSDDIPTRIELARVANQMRKNGEKISEGDSSRIISTNYSIAVTNDAELAPVLAALPPDEAWATYRWLEDNSDSRDDDDPAQSWQRKYIEAKIKEVSGQNTEALTLYRALQKELRGTESLLPPRIATAIKSIEHKQ